MSADLLIRNALLPGSSTSTDIAVKDGRIVRVAPALDISSATVTHDAGGRLTCAGLIETHIHLDKAGIIHRCAMCEGTLAEAVTETAKAKAAFTEEDVYTRAEQVLRQAIVHGTTRMRSFVEIDPRAGFRSFDALLRLKADYAHLITLELCAFAQEGLTNDPETLPMLDAALARGADLVGGCPYTDPDPRSHVEQIFELAQKYDVDVDFHIDFDLSPDGSNIDHVLRETTRRRWGGRTTIGHVTKLSALSTEARAARARQLADAGIALTVLPATDLFLLGRDSDRLSPRGMVPAHRLAREGLLTTLSTNNVLNPFTPFGDTSLMRMANLYANIAQAGTPAELEDVFSMVTVGAAQLCNISDYGIAVGNPADIVIYDAESSSSAVATIAPALVGYKAGRKSFERPLPVLFD